MIRTAVIYVLVNSLVLTFERTLSATLLLGLVVAFYLLNPQPKEPERLFFCGGESGITDIHFGISDNLAVLLVFMLIVLLFVLGYRIIWRC